MKGEHGEFIQFWKRVGIIGAAVAVCASIIAVVSSFAWHAATGPIVRSLETADRSLLTRIERGEQALISRIERLDENFDVITVALRFPPGSRERELVLKLLKPTPGNAEAAKP